jgi:transcriptional regulator with XRE-family HTH domain
MHAGARRLTGSRVLCGVVSHQSCPHEQIEHGQINLTITTLRKIAKNLDTTVSALLKGIL